LGRNTVSVLPSPLTQAELANFLSQPLIAKIATVKADGSPHITPVWSDYDGTSFCFDTSPYNQKAQNIRRNSRVAVCIESPDGRRAVLIEGTADFTEVNPDRYIATLRRYAQPERIEAVRAFYSKCDRITVRVKPTKVISWDYAK
jgi:PPOX class probable F420-dependent enzyme